MRWLTWLPGNAKRRHQQEAADQAHNAEVARVAAIRSHAEQLADGLTRAVEQLEQTLDQRGPKRA